MDSTAQVISETDLLAARKQALWELSQQDFSRVEESVREVLVDVASGVVACQRRGLSAEQSLEAALGVFSSYTGPEVAVESLDSLLTSVARQPERAPEVLGGALSYLNSRGQPFFVRVGDRVYRRKKHKKPSIIGLEKQKYEVVRCVNHLFAYNPLVGHNPLEPTLDQAVLLYGPPGTGKSSLCSYAVHMCREYSAERKIPLRFETFRAADYSKWVGESAQSLRQKLLSVSDPSGVGVLVLDDIDTIVVSRDDPSSSHASVQVTGELMTFLSGVDSDFLGNYVVFGTTNHPQALDSALGRRFKRVLHVPGYSQFSEYTAFVDARLDWASDEVRAVVSEHCFSNNYSPAEIDKTCRTLSSERFGILTSKQLEDPLAHAKKLSSHTVESFLENYCASYKSVR